MPGTNSKGPQWLWVAIQDVGDEWANVIDQHGKMRSITTRIIRTPQKPKVGEWWIVDQSVAGQWTFMAASTGYIGVEPVDPEPVEHDHDPDYAAIDHNHPDGDAALFHWLGL